MRRAAAAKTLSVREKRGGAGGGSLSPWTRIWVAVSGDGSVALIVRGRRRIVLAVLVLVRRSLVSGGVEREGRRRDLSGPDPDRSRGLAALLVPGLQLVGPGRHA